MEEIVENRIREQVLEQHPEFTKDEVDAMTKQELKNRLPEYYMFMHWPMM